jgi:hypothetical protein
MNVITDPSDVLTAPPPRTDWTHGEAEAAVVHTLRRTGRKAVRFDGWQLVEALGGVAGRQVWHDLNLYRTVAGGFVVELIVRHQQPDRHEVRRVEIFNDLAAAAAWLEAYSPADDAMVPPGLAAADTPLPWAVLLAVQLRQRVEQIELDYRSMLSDVFAAIDLTDPAECQASATA